MPITSDSLAQLFESHRSRGRKRRKPRGLGESIESLESRVLLSAVSSPPAEVEVLEAPADAPPVADVPFLQVAVDENAEDAVFDLTTIFSDAEDEELLYRIEYNSNSGLVNATINGTTLTLQFSPNQSGSALVVIRAIDSDGQFAESEFDVTVAPANRPPTVRSPIDDVTVDEDADDTVIDLNFVFTDAEDRELDLSVQSVSDSDLVDASLDGTTLTLSYGADQSGTALVTIRATDSGGLSVTNTFVVTVNAVNDLPTVVTPINDVTVDENADNTVIDLSGVFADVEDQNLTFSVYSNSNGQLLNATIDGDSLTLDYAADQFGTSDITIRATDGDGGFVDTTFEVTVNEVDDGGDDDCDDRRNNFRERFLARLRRLLERLRNRRRGFFWGFRWRWR